MSPFIPARLKGEFISTLVALEMLADPQWRMPHYDPKDEEKWRRESAACGAEADRRVNEYMQQASAAPRDAGALAATASEMLQSGLPLGSEAKTQNALIVYRWAEVGGPEWLPVLEQIVSGRAIGKRRCQ